MDTDYQGGGKSLKVPATRGQGWCGIGPVGGWMHRAGSIRIWLCFLLLHNFSFTSVFAPHEGAGETEEQIFSLNFLPPEYLKSQGLPLALRVSEEVHRPAKLPPGLGLMRSERWVTHLCLSQLCIASVWPAVWHTVRVPPSV